MCPADEVTIGSQEDFTTEYYSACGEDLAVEAYIGLRADLDVAVLAAQDRVAADEDSVGDDNAAVVAPLGIQQDVVVNYHVVADVDLVGMAQHDVAPEDHSAAAGTKQLWVELFPLPEPPRASGALAEPVDQFVLQKLTEARLSDH